MFLIFDTETTGLPKNFRAPISDLENWPRMVQIAWQLHDEFGSLIESKNYIIKPDGYDIPYNSEKIHGISTNYANRFGKDIILILDDFKRVLSSTEIIVGHNIQFDINILLSEFFRYNVDNKLLFFTKIDTKSVGTNYCAIPSVKYGKYKWPTLNELYTKLFNSDIDNAHDASIDVDATSRCFFEMIRLGVIKPGLFNKDTEYTKKFNSINKSQISLIGVKSIKKNIAVDSDEVNNIKKNNSNIKSFDFSNLRCHSTFSILEAKPSIENLIDKAVSFKMKAIGLTDRFNMSGAFHFINYAIKKNIKPILGCELYITEDHKKKKYTKDDPDRRYLIVILAKNLNGFKNLSKLCSYGYIDGYYSGVPRIDKDLLLQYKDDLIITTGNLEAEIPYTILNFGKIKAEKIFQWYNKHFGNDFYIEINRNNIDEEKIVNEILLSFSDKYNVKCFPSNIIYYLDKDDFNSHDILLCIKNAELKKTNIGLGRQNRFGLTSNEFYFKNKDEVTKLFNDLPLSFESLNEIIDKISTYSLKKDVLLPMFEIPSSFKINTKNFDEKDGENLYLKHLAYKGAKKRYNKIDDKIIDRLNYELLTIKNIGYPGYFLIVQDFTNEARRLGVSVGPGRGSAAGSVVAYCIGITNVDPIKYNLLFERFLNPDRISLPDIDIDFDDEGRSKIIDFVLRKYGYNQVAQIITFGRMGGKSSIRDVSRVLDLPLYEADKLAKLVPNISLKNIFKLTNKELTTQFSSDDSKLANQLKSLINDNSKYKMVIDESIKLEGSIRNSGIHACGIIITPDNILNHIPVSTTKDSSLLVTQFDNSVVENAGLLKMDFLGLKTLSIIKDCILLIKKNKNIILDIDNIPLNDEKTLKLYQKGNTNATFQFESPGMQKHLRSLKPDKFDDLIAMNALYRPGPLEYIPNFISRKHGREEIKYDLDGMEEFLSETYGITVYQEQVMLLSQKLANFSKGEADTLRKAMGKKDLSLLETMKTNFINGCKKNGHDQIISKKIWKDWESFAAYAFNKSHSTCYSVIAFQTAYLKANYPAEYMACVLTHNMNDLKKITFFMEECKRIGLSVLGPDINESFYTFDVNKQGKIRFGLGAVKGVGENAVENIIQSRESNGNFKNIFSITKSVNHRIVNKRTLENLALAGAFDNFYNKKRSVYFFEDEKGVNFISKAINFGVLYKENLNAPPDLFGGSSDFKIIEPDYPKIDEWDRLDLLAREKEVIGMYISGHPLDDYKLEIKYNCNHNIIDFDDLNLLNNKILNFAGVITSLEEKVDKKGNPYCIFSIEDYTDSKEFLLFRNDYTKFIKFLLEGAFLFVSARVQKRSWDNNLEIKILSINQLSNVFEKMTNSITLRIDLNDIDNIFVNKLIKVLVNHKGKHKLKLNVFDSDEINNSLDFISRSYRVKISKEFINQLSQIINVEYKLN